MLLHNVNAYSKNIPSHSESTLLCSCSPWFTQRTSSPSWHCNTYNWHCNTTTTPDSFPLVMSVYSVYVYCIHSSVPFMYSNMWQEHIRMGNLIKDDLNTQVARSYALLPHAVRRVKPGGLEMRYIG